ncbi:CHAD domain-containing protein [Roseateles sp. GG27B]
MTPAQGLLAVLLTCQTQILVNAAPIAGGEFGPEHVHQLRVGLRRLRSGLRLFDGLLPDLQPALLVLSEAAAEYFRLLGDTRDGDVLASLWGPAVQEALRAAGLEPAVAAVSPSLATANVNVVEIVQAAPQQAVLADLAQLIRAISSAAAALAPPQISVAHTKRAAASAANSAAGTAAPTFAALAPKFAQTPPALPSWILRPATNCVND